MKQLHMCPRNFDIRNTDKPAIEIYTYDRREEKTYYIDGEIVFYCPYCGIELKGDRPLKR